MQHREKYLLIGLLAALAIWQGSGPLDTLFMKPIRDREQKINTLQDEVKNRTTRQLDLLRAQKQFKEWSLRSLPPDPLVASTTYQNWLIELASHCKLTQVSVIPSRVDARPKGDTYYSIVATIKAEATLSQLCDFVFRLRQSGLLHRVNQMTVEASRHEGNPSLEVTMVVEGLALTNSPARATLTADGLAELLPKLDLPNREDYAAIEKKHLFVRSYKEPTRSTPVASSTASPVENIDAAEYVFLVSSIARGDTREAWLYDRTANKKSDLVEGRKFTAAGVEGTVVTIGSDFVVLKIRDEEWRLELGQNLRQIKKPESQTGAKMNSEATSTTSS